MDLDSTWEPVKKYQTDVLRAGANKNETLYFDTYDPDELENVIEVQHKITKHLKQQGRKKLFSILIIVDDFADDPKVTRQSKLLHSLFYARPPQQHLDDRVDAKIRELPPDVSGQHDCTDCV